MATIKINIACVKKPSAHPLDRLWKTLGTLGVLLLVGSAWSGAESKSMLLPMSAEIRIGDRWDKEVVTEKSFDRLPDQVQKLVHATASVAYRRRAPVTLAPGSMNQFERPADGSAIYLGAFQGEHLMMSNRHVMPSRGACQNAVVVFKDFKTGKSWQFFCKDVWLTLSPGDRDRTDVSFFTIDAATNEWGIPGRAKRNRRFLVGREASLDFRSPLWAGTRLAQAGYGKARDLAQGISVQHGGDCMILSRGLEMVRVRLGGGFPVMDVLAMGCDGAIGDSGSGIMDLASGRVIGLFAAVSYSLDEKGKPKNDHALIQDSALLELWVSLLGPVPDAQGVSSLVPLSDIGPKVLARLESTDAFVTTIAADGLRELLKR